MRKSLTRRFCLFASVLLLSLTIISCGSTKNTRYFQDIPDSGQLKTIAKAEYSAPLIQADDILTILVQVVDPLATTSINAANVPIQSTVSAVGSQNLPSSALAGVLVDKDGYIDEPVLGHIKLEGYNTSQAREIILKEARKYYNDPTVIVRYANFKFSVTGEVLKPGVYVTPNEKVSILDAIALAGDLTIFGKRDNVLLIRENSDGTKTPYRINLKKSDIISSPYYYLRQNDIIYVEPGKGKVAATDAAQARLFTIVGAAISVLIVLITRVK